MTRIRKPNREASTRSMLAVALAVTLLGIVLSVQGIPELGSWATVGGLVALMTAVHRLGRLGPDEGSRSSRRER
jgi:hypothetical protein